jgi:VWFA-related protein
VERARLSRVVFVCLLIGITSASPRVSSQTQTATPTPAATQTPPTDQPAAQPTFRVGATYVRVDAYVTRDGKPVTDLTKDDFEVYEDGVRQTIRNFELVNIPAGFTQTAPRTDPNTVAAMRERVADPRRRVFVLFLDTYHSSLGSSMSSRKAFLRFLQRIVGPDDLIAGMTPEMSPDALTFGSRTEALDSLLNDIWGRRDALRQDPYEDLIQRCYMRASKDVWERLRDRRRTKLTLDSLEELVQHVGAMRDERKAIITVTEGWRLFGEDLKLAEDPDSAPGVRPLHTGPVIRQPNGYGADDPRNQGTPRTDCDTIRLDMANIETVQQFRNLPNEANRVNASFYIIDPRGLPASDDLLGSPPLTADLTMLKTKQAEMRELADRTDGMALFYSNDLDKELTRIADDLSSYYLLGYDSTNGKLDGAYRALKIKVTRPGVLVRARQGYRAATLPVAGSSHSRTGSNAPSETSSEITSAVSAIMGTRADLPVHLRATAVRLVAATTANGPAQPLSELRLVAELDPKVAASDAWTRGGTAHFLVRGDGVDGLSAEATLQPRARFVTATIPVPPSVKAGECHVQMRLTAQSHTDALSDSTAVQVAAPGLIATPALLKRGPSTGTAYLATADLRFRRADRLRLEAPSRLSAAQVHVTAVDQRGQPLNLPIQVTDRQDGAGAVIVADISLAPLAPGGYAVILAANANQTGQERLIVPFELVP